MSARRVPLMQPTFFFIFLLTCLTTERVLVKDRNLFFVFALHFEFNTNMHVYYEHISCTMYMTEGTLISRC